MSTYGYVSDGRAVPTCLRCGTLVTNQTAHDKHHEEIDAMTALTVTTAHNLMSTLNALLDADIGVKVAVIEVPE
jgi:hypothetical protein